jgi:putative transposase
MKDRVEVAKTLRAEYPARMLCRLFNISPSTFYYSSLPKRDLTNLRITIETLLVMFPFYGARKMYDQLLRDQVFCTRQEVSLIYRELGLLRKRPPPKVRTTDSRHEHTVYPNLVVGLKVVRPNQVWVADTTYLKIGGRTAYLALVEDRFTRRILGWEISFANNAELTTTALQKALFKGRPEIHHSDQGKTYAADRYVRLLIGCLISMAAVGRPKENPHAERLNRTVKDEEIYRSDYQNIAQAREGLAAYVKLYNELRMHSSLKKKTPNEFLKDSLEEKTSNGNLPSKDQ